jgi:hypothetical protein
MAKPNFWPRVMKFSRSIQAEVEKTGEDGAAGEMVKIEWTERVFIVRSVSYHNAQLESLENRLQKATEKQKVLTPTPGRGNPDRPKQKILTIRYQLQPSLVNRKPLRNIRKRWAGARSLAMLQ